MDSKRIFRYHGPNGSKKRQGKMEPRTSLVGGERVEWTKGGTLREMRKDRPKGKRGENRRTLNKRRGGKGGRGGERMEGLDVSFLSVDSLADDEKVHTKLGKFSSARGFFFLP